MRQPLIDADRVCKTCKETKPLTSFVPCKECVSGFAGSCKACAAVRSSVWSKVNRERLNEMGNAKRKSKKEEAVTLFGGVCHDCNVAYPPYVFQFHHLDPSKKDANPSHSMSNGAEKMWEELSKCVMLCANCHIIRHRGKSETTDGKE